MNVNITEKDKQTYVELSGRLDTMTAPEFQQTVEQAFSPERPEIVVDCKELDYISSSGLRAWVALHKMASQQGGKLTLLNLNPQVNEVLRMTGLASVFEL